MKHKTRQQHLEDSAAYKAAAMQFQKDAVKFVAIDPQGAAHFSACAVWALTESVRCLNYAAEDYSQWTPSSPPKCPIDGYKPKKKKK